MSPRRAVRRAAVAGVVAGNVAGKKSAAAAQQQAATAAAAVEPAEPSQSMDAKAADLKQLKELLDQGVLTQEEFDAQKAKILAG